MEDTYVIDHIKELCKQRGWTCYRLSKESGIPHSSLNTMLNKQHIPSMNNLIKICKGFNITLAQFFAGIDNEITDEHSEILTLWNSLDNESKKIAKIYMYGLAHKEISYTTPNMTTHGKEMKNNEL